MRLATALLILGLCGLPTAAAAQCVPFVPLTSPLPALTGRLAYVNGDTGQLLMYDFRTSSFVTIPQTSWGLTAATNPVFSPDGQYLLFSAVQSDQRHIYSWHIGSASVVNLTLSMGNLRNEDPKYLANGKEIVWKQNFGISVANISYDGSGNPSLSNVVHVVSGIQNDPSEASAPVFTPTGKYIYYYTSKGSDAQVQRYTTATGAIAHYPKDAGVQYYYPVAPDLGDFYFVRWVDNSANHFDQIWQYSVLRKTAVAWAPADCAASNSDPAPIDEDYFVYSRTNNADSTRYELYIGYWAANNAWSLAALGINGSSGNMLGANYTTVPSGP